MAKNVKPTTKNSPAIKTGKNPNNKAAEAYAKNGTGVAAMKAVIDDGNTNKLYGDVITPSTPAMGVSVSNRSRGPKTDGIEVRGSGAATKGRVARGPMA